MPRTSAPSSNAGTRHCWNLRLPKGRSRDLVRTKSNGCAFSFVETSTSGGSSIVTRHLGYGGSLKDAGRAIGRSGDDGLDGVIKEDHLGLDAIYIQAKRWTNKVGRPDVQSFAGSLEGVRGRKGVFITTSAFSAEAREYVSRIEKKIVLIDGVQLASLMIDFNIGVSTVNAYEVKKVDSDFFSEE